MPDLSVIITPLIQALQRNTESYSKFAEEMRAEQGRGVNIPGRAGRSAKSRVQQKEAEQVKKSVESFKKLQSTMDDINIVAKRGEKLTAAHGDALREAASAITASGINLTDAQKGMIRTIDAISFRGHATNEQLAELTEQTAEAVSIQSDMAIAKEKEIEKTDRYLRSLDTGIDYTKKLAKEFFTLKSAAAQITGSLILTSKHFNETIQRQQYSFSLFNEGLQDSAILTGMSTDVLNKTFADHRQMILATSGTYGSQREAGVKWLKTIDELQLKMQDYTNDADEAGMLIMDSASLFAKQAIKVSQEEIASALPSFIDQLKRVTKLTGVQGTAIVGQLKGYMDSEEARKTLLQMNIKDRRNYVHRLAQEAEYFAAQGKTIDQFIQAKNALAGLSGVSPKQRLQEAARITAMAGAMGMGVSPAMMHIMAKPTGARTKQEQNEMQDFATQFVSRREQMLGSGGPEMFAMGGLMEQAQGPVMNALEQMSTAGQEGLKLAKQQVDAATKGTKALDGMAEMLNDAFQRIDKYLSPWFNDPTIGLISGTMTGLFTIIKNAIIFALGSAAVFKVLGATTGSIGRGSISQALKPGKIGKSLGTVAGGIIAYDVGQAIGTSIYERNQEGIGNVVDATVGFFDKYFGAPERSDEEAKQGAEAATLRREALAEQKKTNQLLMKEEQTIKASAEQADANAKISQAGQKTSYAPKPEHRVP